MGKELGTTGSTDVAPVHTVTLTGFYMGKYEVTQEQYQTVMGTNPSNFSSNPAAGETQGKRPVENVTWYDAIEFCNKLSALEGLQEVYTISGRTPATGYPITSATVTVDWSKNGYRLPTEAQWEYAAKGGNGTPGNYTYAGSNTIDDVAWYSGNSSSRTHEVGKKAANALGLYDMSGNVMEWCWDWYDSYSSVAQTDPTGAASGTDRVLRGGYWYVAATEARSIRRNSYFPNGRTNYIGFRVVRP
jgi:formylglycine-generating enzyme required for sulfatase activity